MSVDHAAGFYAPWALALAASSAEPTVAIVAAPVLHFVGLELPVVQSVLAIAGVLMARPLARKREAGLSLLHFALVSLVMIVVALAWVAESKPGVLFTFVVAIGLGFSGYSLIEAAGDEIQNFIRRVIAQVTGRSISGEAKVNVFEWAVVAFIIASILYHVWRTGAANPTSTGELGGSVAGLSSKLTGLSGRVGAVEKKLEELEREAATVKDIERIEEKIETVYAKMEGHQALSQRTNHSVDRIERMLIERGLGR